MASVDIGCPRLEEAAARRWDSGSSEGHRKRLARVGVQCGRGSYFLSVLGADPGETWDLKVKYGNIALLLAEGALRCIDHSI